MFSSNGVSGEKRALIRTWIFRLAHTKNPSPDKRSLFPTHASFHWTCHVIMYLVDHALSQAVRELLFHFRRTARVGKSERLSGVGNLDWPTQKIQVRISARFSPLTPFDENDDVAV